MTIFGRPSVAKDMIGIAMVTATIALLWIESSLAAGGATAVETESAVGVGVEAVMMTTTTVPAGLDCSFSAPLDNANS